MDDIEFKRYRQGKWYRVELVRTSHRFFGFDLYKAPKKGSVWEVLWNPNPFSIGSRENFDYMRLGSFPTLAAAKEFTVAMCVALRFDRPLAQMHMEAIRDAWRWEDTVIAYKQAKEPHDG